MISNKIKAVFRFVICVLPITAFIVNIVIDLLYPYDYSNENRLFTTADLWPRFSDKLVLAVGFLGFIAALYYAIQSFRGKCVPIEKRVLWDFALLFGSLIVLPFFWYHYLRNTNGNAT